MSPTNQKLAALFHQMAQVMQVLGGDSFRILAFQKVTRVLEDLSQDIAAIGPDAKKLTAIDGIGKGTAERIIEFLNTGAIAEHDHLMSQIPMGLPELLNVPGLGPKTVALLWKQGGIKTLEDLKNRLRDDSLAELPGLGVKKLENLRKSVVFAQKGQERFNIGRVLPLARQYVDDLCKVEGAKEVQYAGSLRRGQETIGDLDILVAATPNSAAAVSKAFIALAGTAEILGQGPTKSSIRTDQGLQVDLRVVAPESYGAALLYFTGSKEHNVQLRQRAIDRGMKLNEYGLYRSAVASPEVAHVPSWIESLTESDLKDRDLKQKLLDYGFREWIPYVKWVVAIRDSDPTKLLNLEEIKQIEEYLIFTFSDQPTRPYRNNVPYGPRFNSAYWTKQRFGKELDVARSTVASLVENDPDLATIYKRCCDEIRTGERWNACATKEDRDELAGRSGDSKKAAPREWGFYFFASKLKGEAGVCEGYIGKAGPGKHPVGIRDRLDDHFRDKYASPGEVLDNLPKAFFRELSHFRSNTIPGRSTTANDTQRDIVVAARTEEEIYKALGLNWIPPELREARDEIERAEKGPLPKLIELADIKAELHAHTTASDGRMTIEELAAAAVDRGFHTIAITDHSVSQVIANGLSAERLEQHIQDVRAVAAKLKGKIAVLVGSEVDIKADGTLDYPNSLLKELDIVIASPHSALSQDPNKATARLVKAIGNPYVTIVGHPTGRLILRREGLNPDMGEVIAAAAERGVALEINANSWRLDLRDAHARRAIEAGVKLAVNTDAHSPSDFDQLLYGVLTARRAGATAANVVNCLGREELAQWLKSTRK